MTTSQKTVEFKGKRHPYNETIAKINALQELLKDGEMFASDVAKRLGYVQRNDSFTVFLLTATQMIPSLYEDKLGGRSVLGLNSEFWLKAGTENPYATKEMNQKTQGERVRECRRRYYIENRQRLLAYARARRNKR